MSSVLQQLLKLISSGARSVRDSLRKAFVIIESHRTSFLAFQIGYHSLIFGAMGAAAFYPKLQSDAWVKTEADLRNSSLGRLVLEAYGKQQPDGSVSGGNVALAAGLTLPINLLLGSFLVITAPSMVFPLSGLLITGTRAILWGLLFSPYYGFQKGYVSVSHLLTMVMEGQGYVLAALGVWIHGKPALGTLGTKFRSVNHEDEAGQPLFEADKDRTTDKPWWPHYRAGIRETVHLYSLITVILAIAAVWEAYEAIYWPPRPLKLV